MCDFQNARNISRSPEAESYEPPARARARKAGQKLACLREIGDEFEKIGAAAARYNDLSLLDKQGCAYPVARRFAGRKETE
jgi:hypothetical protein